MRKLPAVTTDRGAATFVRLNMRLPEELLAAVKDAAADRGIPYQRFIRQALERALTSAK